MDWLNRAGTRLSHADLLEVLLNQPDEFARIARHIGFEQVAEPVGWVVEHPDIEVRSGRSSRMVDTGGGNASPSLLSPADRPQIPFHYVAHRERSERHLNPVPPELPQWYVDAQPLEDDEVYDPGAVAPSWQPLTRKPRLWGQLRQYLKQSEQTELPDIPRILDQLARGGSLRRIPLQRQARRIRQVRVIFDDAKHLRTARGDVQQLYLDLIDYWGASRVRFQRVQDEPLRTLTKRQLAADTALIVLSDCGVMTGKSAQWEALFRRVRQAGVTCLVLGLAARRDLRVVCTHGVRAFSWDQGLVRVSGDGAENDGEADEAENTPVSPEVEKLLSYLAFTYRIEPGLLRDVRANLGLDVGVEAQCRLHEAVDDDGWYLYLRDDVLEKYRALFAQLPEVEQRRAVDWVKQHHSILPRSVLDYELVVAQAYCDWAVPGAMAARDYLRRFAVTFQGQADSALIGHWAEGYCRTQAGNEADIAAALFVTLHRQALAAGEYHDLVLPKGVGLDDIAQFIRLGEDQQGFQLRETAAGLRLNTADGVEGFRLLDSESVSGVVKLDGVISSLGELLPVVSGDGLHVDTGTEQITIRSTHKPDWAEAIGRDQHGLFVECVLNGQLNAVYYPEWGGDLQRDEYGVYSDLSVRGVVQRMRWITPGRFMMGSPQTEEKWVHNEDYHEVTLTQGYWLADTACTQELWQALTGNNPADFKDDLQNPVESMSWLDVQEFLKVLQGLIPGSQPRLPIEAEWEYACRAGTTTPFSFGENIDPFQVNYRGTAPYADGGNGEYREKTVPVKFLPVNPWGLYEMHGNVWEWCSDEYQSNLGSNPVTDPLTVESPESLGRSDAYRVLRGGSWIDVGGNCRSAYRLRDPADLRLRRNGFRLALGHELRTSQALGEGEKRSEQADQQAARRGVGQVVDQAGNGLLGSLVERAKGVFKGRRNQ